MPSRSQIDGLHKALSVLHKAKEGNQIIFKLFRAFVSRHISAAPI